MKRLLFGSLIMFSSHSLFAQRYEADVESYRSNYKNEFLTDEKSPLKASDTSFLRFFEPDIRYKVIANFEPSKDTNTIIIPTHSGKKKAYKVYGAVSFKLPMLKGQFQLQVYRSMDLMKSDKYKDHLFLPFTDATNYRTTYAGGRYIDLSIADIQKGKIEIDFNKAYNPYCAYADGYNCPIPPKENKLVVKIPAGEKMFAKPITH